MAYLAGTWSSRRAGAATSRYGRLGVLLVSIAVMIGGTLLTLVPALPFVLGGLVILTVGFFGAHATASGWTAARATVGRAQAASLYNLFYYLGSSVVGLLGGIVFTRDGWDATALTVAGLGAVAAAWACLASLGRRRPADPRRRRALTADLSEFIDLLSKSRILTARCSVFHCDFGQQTGYSARLKGTEIMARKVFNGRKVSKRLVMGAVATATVAGAGLGSAATADAATGPAWSSVSPSAVSGAVSATASGAQSAGPRRLSGRS